MEFKVDDLGSFLKNIRKEKRLTLSYVACKSELSPGYIGRIERNSSKPSLETLIKLSQILGFDMDDVVENNLDLAKTLDIVDTLSSYNFTIDGKKLSRFELNKIINIIETIYSVSWEDETEKYFGVNSILGNIKEIKERENKGNE